MEHTEGWEGKGVNPQLDQGQGAKTLHPPASQGPEQSGEPDAGYAPYFPGGHGMHASAPPVLYFPTAHGDFVVPVPARQKYPTGQGPVHETLVEEPKP